MFFSTLVALPLLLLVGMFFSGVLASPFAPPSKKTSTTSTRSAPPRERLHPLLRLPGQLIRDGCEGKLVENAQGNYITQYEDWVPADDDRFLIDVPWSTVAERFNASTVRAGGELKADHAWKLTVKGSTVVTLMYFRIIR